MIPWILIRAARGLIAVLLFSAASPSCREGCYYPLSIGHRYLTPQYRWSFSALSSFHSEAERARYALMRGYLGSLPGLSHLLEWYYLSFLFVKEWPPAQRWIISYFHSLCDVPLFRLCGVGCRATAKRQGGLTPALAPVDPEEKIKNNISLSG